MPPEAPGAEAPAVDTPRTPEYRLEIFSGPDRMGRSNYSYHWPTGYIAGHPDGEYGDYEWGQYFFNVIPEELLEDEEMRIVDHRGHTEADRCPNLSCRKGTFR